VGAAGAVVGADADAAVAVAVADEPELNVGCTS
jgi:hypothetical protein